MVPWFFNTTYPPVLSNVSSGLVSNRRALDAASLPLIIVVPEPVSYTHLRAHET